MWARQTLTGATLRNADTFLEQNANAFPTIAGSGARRKLRRALASLNAHAEDQARNSLVAKGTTQKYRALRVALMRDHMSPIAGIALAALADAPEVAKLRMPRGRPSAQRLALAATAMRSAAEPFSDAFVAAGLAPDFLVQLTAAADAMMDALGQRAQTLGRRAGATRGVEEQLRQGRQAIAAHRWTGSSPAY